MRSTIFTFLAILVVGISAAVVPNVERGNFISLDRNTEDKSLTVL